MSKSRILIHLVFATKGRVNSLPIELKNDLHNYLCGVFRQNNCHVLSINSVRDHVHILMDLNPTIALAPFVKELKTASGQWMRQDSRFTQFQGWCRGYYAGSISPSHIEGLRKYITDQESHHLINSMENEIRIMAEKYNLIFHEEDMR